MYNQAQLEKKLKQIIKMEPLSFANSLDAAKTMMILARFDAVVPYKNGIALYKKIGKPECIFLPTGHYTAIVYVPYIRYQSLKFFRKTLNFR